MGTHPIFESDFDCLTDMSDGPLNDGKKVDLGFIYKMLDTRDPSKRRVKPADPDFITISTTETAEDDLDTDYVPIMDDDEIEISEDDKKSPNENKPTETTTDEPQKKKSPNKRKSNATKEIPAATRSSKRKKRQK